MKVIEDYLNNDSIIELKGENRDFEGSKLFVDLIPESCWFNNARTCIDSNDWNRLRNFIYVRANYTCECCGSKEALEAHERWYFNEELRVQKLMRIIALCKQCHEVTHIGLANVKGRFDIALDHLMKVTKMTLEQANSHIDKAFAIWELRNQHEWSLDLSILTNSGIKLSKLESKANSSDINNFYYPGDMILNLDEHNFSSAKQQAINCKPKISNNKPNPVAANYNKQNPSGLELVLKNIKILLEIIKTIIRGARANLKTKRNKHLANEWILEEFFFQLQKPNVFGTPISDPHFCPGIKSIEYAHNVEKHLPLLYVWYVPNTDRVSLSVNGFVVRKVLSKIIPENYKNFDLIQKRLITILFDMLQEFLERLPINMVPHEAFDHSTLHLENPRCRSFC